MIKFKYCSRTPRLHTCRGTGRTWPCSASRTCCGGFKGSTYLYLNVIDLSSYVLLPKYIHLSLYFTCDLQCDKAEFVDVIIKNNVLRNIF